MRLQVPLEGEDTLTFPRETVSILGYDISARGLESDVQQAWQWLRSGGRTHVVNCTNPHSLVSAGKDKQFSTALRNTDLLLPDGIGIVIAARLLKQVIPGRVAGSEFFMALSELVESKGGTKYYFLGSRRDVLMRISSRLNREFPSIEVCGQYSPPYRAEFSVDESQRMIEGINRTAPDVLWVGMTAPKQEKWVEQHRDSLKVPLVSSIGAAFDFYAGTRKRAPKWMRDSGLEWLPRLLREPRRLWNRTFVSSPQFLGRVLAYRLRGWKT